MVRGVGASITDANGNVWTINPNGQVAVDGKTDSTTAGVDELAYYNSVVWQKNLNNKWYSKTAPSAPGVAWTGASPPVPIPGVSGNDANIVAGSTATLVDANGNVWGLTKVNSAQGYQIADDGAIDRTTRNVVQMAVVHGVFWQENTAGLWYSKPTPATAWSRGTTTGVPEPVSVTWVGGGRNLASNPADWSPAVAPTAGEALTMTSGTMNIVGNALARETLSISFFDTVNISASGAASLNLAMPEPGATVNITVASGSTLTLNAYVTSSYLNASGGTIAFIGDNSFNGFETVIDDNLTGTATLALTGGNANGELMEINGSVDRGLTFDINAGSAPDASLQIDQPGRFQGLIDLTNSPVGLGHVAFEGIRATSGVLLNGILQMFNGNALVDTTRITGGSALQLHQNCTGVILTAGSYSDIPPDSLGTVIPLHT